MEVQGNVQDQGENTGEGWPNLDSEGGARTLWGDVWTDTKMRAHGRIWGRTPLWGGGVHQGKVLPSREEIVIVVFTRKEMSQGLEQRQ